MLALDRVSAGYGPVAVLHEVSLRVSEGEMVCLLGANGAGKSTTVRTISGLLRPTAGTITFLGDRLDGRPAHAVLKRGIAQCPEGRRIFPEMTVQENLEMGAYVHGRAGASPDELARVFRHFPRLQERAGQLGGTLSGGEQQMLAIARALMSSPRLLLLDEPSLGLAPTMVETVFRVIAEIRRQGVTVLMVEQNAALALRMADRAYVMESGRIALEGPARDLLDNADVRRAYLGG
ncbi:MAG TPA: ABC transporter ATP-binding protein [Methylomirabilota bacterium]